MSKAPYAFSLTSMYSFLNFYHILLLILLIVSPTFSRVSLLNSDSCILSAIFLSFNGLAEITEHFFVLASYSTMMSAQ